MSHCTCGSGHGTSAIASVSSTVTGGTTVDEIMRRPGAREVLQRLGINHCCGGQLPLREAAAAAGISVDEALAALAAEKYA